MFSSSEAMTCSRSEWWAPFLCHAPCETAPATRRTAPWHLWAVGIGFVLLNFGGVYDYVMALNENADYFRSQNYNSEQIQYFTDYPVAPAVFWTLGVWDSLLAAILLLSAPGGPCRSLSPGRRAKQSSTSSLSVSVTAGSSWNRAWPCSTSGSWC